MRKGCHQRALTPDTGSDASRGALKTKAAQKGLKISAQGYSEDKHFLT